MSPIYNDSEMVGNEGQYQENSSASHVEQYECNNAVMVKTEIDPSRNNNNLVAESDYRAAVNVFLSQLDESPQDGHDTSIVSLKHQVFSSMGNYLARIAQPVSDQAFHKYCSDMEKQQQKQSQNQRDGNAAVFGGVNMDDSTCSMSGEANFEIEDFEEDELIDTDALSRVRDLRQKVREQAQKVVKVRQNVLDEASSMAQKQMEQLCRSRKNRTSAVGEAAKDDNDVEEHARMLAKGEEAIQKMQRTLQNTKEHLKSTETKLPKLLEKWQRQIEVLHESEQWSLSQTEQVLRTATKETILPEPNGATAEDKFMHFLG